MKVMPRDLLSYPSVCIPIRSHPTPSYTLPFPPIRNLKIITHFSWTTKFPGKVKSKRSGVTLNGHHETLTYALPIFSRLLPFLLPILVAISLIFIPHFTTEILTKLLQGQNKKACVTTVST